MKILIFLLIIIIVSIYFINCELKFEIGEEYQYSVDLNVQSFGEKETGRIGQTSFSKVTTTFIMKCISKEKNTFTFSANLYDTEILSSQKENEKLINQNEKQKHQGKLGKDIFFTQKNDGTILKYRLDTTDEITFSHIKVSIIENLQTQISKNRGNVQIEDVHGVHSTLISTVLKDGVLNVKREFNENDFTSFSDNNVKKENVKIKSVADASIVNGNIIAANCEHVTLLKNTNQKNRDLNDDELNFSMGSKGNISMKLIKIIKHKSRMNYDFKDLKEATAFNIGKDFVENQRKINGFPSTSSDIDEPIVIRNKKSFREEDYPFHKQFNASRTWGSKDKIAATIYGELFVGTNFDCKHESLNYKALAQVDADVTLFGITKNAFEAKFVYARKNGGTAEDDIHLKVFDKVIYQQYIGKYLNCIEKKQDIYHTQKLFEIKYVLFVFSIPVSFKAGVAIKIAVDWDWKVCPADLSALIELTPFASLIVYGNVEVNILIAKVGVELDGSFNIRLIPQAYVHGSQCAVGFDLLLRTDPMNINLYGYFDIKKCKGWFFTSCSWKEIKKFDIFKWALPSKEEVLFKKEFPIVKP